MIFLPICVRVEGRRVLIVGGGKVAAHKAAILARFTSEATVIAPEVAETIKGLPFTWKEKAFEESDLDGADLLFICTGDHALNRKIKRAAQRRHILASVSDDPLECDFISPAIFPLKGLTISVASDGLDVRRSIRVRDRIKEAVENDTLPVD